MPQLDPSVFPTQIVWLAITFVLLYLILSRVALPRVAEVLEARQKKIDDDLDKAAKLKSEAEATLKAYERAIADARAEAQATLREASEDAAKEAQARGNELNERLGRDIRAAEDRIAAAKRDAVASIAEIATDAARRATERLVGKAPEAGAARAAVDAALKAGRQ
jgi:F-type H+-transporting ATPase subunit b